MGCVLWGGGGDKKTMRIQGICVGNQTLKIMKNNEKSERASESIWWVINKFDCLETP